MSKYTTEVRYICETYSELSESTGYSNIEKIIASAIPKIFDFKFPIFDEKYRNVLETKIIRHYYTREIGAETVGLWKHWLNTKLNEIMPYYNQLYKSELLEFNPLYDVDISREHTSTSNGTKKDTGETTGTATTEETGRLEGTGTNTNKNSNYYSDTPQGGVSNLENLKYLTNATLDSFNGTATTTNNTVNNGSTSTSGLTKNDSIINNTEQYLEQVRGKQGSSSYAKMLEEYRATFLNIDMQIINELSNLFMNLW